MSEISENNRVRELNIQKDLEGRINKFESFCFDAGAGAGKTFALKECIRYILENESENLESRNQKVLCITYTNAAKNEVLERVGKNSSLVISTIHEFLWEFISPQQKLLHEIYINKLVTEIKREKIKLQEIKKYNILEENEHLKDYILDVHFKEIFYKNYSEKSKIFKSALLKFCEDSNNVDLIKEMLSNVNNFRKIVNSVYKIDNLERVLYNNEYKKIKYIPTQNKDKLENFIISHDTLLEFSRDIITNNNVLKRLFVNKYPYVLVDEYQDTDGKVIDIFNSLLQFTEGKNSFVVGYFGDEVQNIYDTGVGYIKNDGLKRIKKEFNRRSSPKIIEVIGKIRNDDLNQVSIYNNIEDGKYDFYVSGDSFELGEFIKNNNISGNIGCLLMKNEEIAKARGFNIIHENISKFPRFNNSNYGNINSEFLQKNLQIMPSCLRNILKFVEFIVKVNDDNSTVKMITDFIPNNNSKITFGEFNNLIREVKNIDECNEVNTLKNYIEKVSQLSVIVKGEQILKEIFMIEETSNSLLLEIKNIVYDYMYFTSGNEEIGESEFENIDSFFEISFSQFKEWYYYISEFIDKKGINYFTLHGSKGLEFENVVVVLKDNFANKKDYIKYFFEHYNNLNLTDKDLNRYKKVRNLLYVACSRAIENLYVVYINEEIKLESNDEKSVITKNIESIFNKINVIS